MRAARVIVSTTVGATVRLGGMDEKKRRLIDDHVVVTLIYISKSRGESEQWRREYDEFTPTFTARCNLVISFPSLPVT